MKIYDNITIGSDPEYGVIDIETGTPISCVGLLGGTKEKPIDIGNGCTKMEDNVAAEITIPPVTNELDFINYIVYGRSVVDDHLLESGCKTVATSTLKYPLSQLKTKEAQEFRCVEALDVYTRDEIMPPKVSEDYNMRSFGAHIHIGWKGEKSAKTFLPLIYMLDAYLSLPALFIDNDRKRRELYGKAGEFRIKPYGIEYRSLGGGMLESTDRLSWIFTRTMEVIDAINNNLSIVNTVVENKESIREAINTYDLDTAYALLNKLKIENPSKALI